jgi:hypothetical protein
MGIAYIPGSAKILTNVTSMVSGYGSTTTDHYPVSARYDMRFFKNPIDTRYFVGVPWKSDVEFFWYTGHEINSNYFVIERSRNGKQFEAVDSLKGKGDSREWSIYNLNLKDPWPGKSYYRLRIMSLDGTVSYSYVITINMRSGSRSLSVNSAEPAMTRVQYIIPETEKGTLQLMDINGRIYFERTMTFVKGKNLHNIPTGNVPMGTYIIRIVHADRIESEKVVIKK